MRQTKKIYGATGYQGDTALTAPPFFDQVHRGKEKIWGHDREGPLIINWCGLSAEQQIKLIPKLRHKTDWIILSIITGNKTTLTPPLKGAKLVARASGNASRKKSWWMEGDDGLVSYSFSTTVWIHDRILVEGSPHCPLYKNSTPLQEFEPLRIALNTNSKKDGPERNKEGVEEIYWAGPETGLLRIPEFPGVIYATDGSKTNEGMGAGFYRHDTKQGGCCKVGRTEEGLSSNRPEYVAAWMDLTREIKDDLPIMIPTDSLCLLTSI